MTKKKNDTKTPTNVSESPRGVFFQNYDLYDVSGPGPGTGFYSHMSEYKSVSDFLKKKRKNKDKLNKNKLSRLLYFKNLLKQAKDNSGDCSLLDDPTEGQIEPINWNSAEIAGSPVGLLDGIYPKEDLENKPVTNLYYGRIESHYAKDKD